MKIPSLAFALSFVLQLSTTAPSYSMIEPKRPDGQLFIALPHVIIRVPDEVHVCPAIATDAAAGFMSFWVNNLIPKVNATHCDDDGGSTFGVVVFQSRVKPMLGDITTHCLHIHNNSVYMTSSLFLGKMLSPAEAYILPWDGKSAIYQLSYNKNATDVVYTCSQMPGVGVCGAAFEFSGAIAGFRWYPHAYRNRMFLAPNTIMNMACALNGSLHMWSSNNG